MKKRLLSILLTICMVLSLLPATALAADPTPVLAAGSVARTTTLDLATNANLSYRATDGTTKSKNPTTTSITDTAEGWSWDKNSLKLTLSGVHIQVPNQTVASTASRGIYLPGGNVTIALTPGTQNLVRAGDAGMANINDRSAAIDVAANGSVTISGTGELVAIGGKAFISIGIATWPLIINGGAQVTAIGADASDQSNGISSTTVTVDGQATRVNAIAGKTTHQLISNGILATGGFTLTDGTVLASGHMRGIDAGSTSSISVNGGLLIAKGVGTAGKALSAVATGSASNALAGTNDTTSTYTVLGNSGTYKTNTTPLVFATDDVSVDNLATNGYKWDKDAQTLTLTNCIVTPASGAIYNGIKLPAGATLNLVGNNVVRGRDEATDFDVGKAAAIYGSGALTINGTGGLTAIAGKNTDDDRSCGIFTDSNSNLTFSGGAKVTALADAQTSAYGIWAGSQAIVSDAGTALTALGFSSDAGTADSETQGILSNSGFCQINVDASVVSIGGPASKSSQGTPSGATVNGQLLAVGMNSTKSVGVVRKVTTSHVDARLKASGGTGTAESYGIGDGYAGSAGTVTAVAGNASSSYGIFTGTTASNTIALSGTAKLHAVGNTAALWDNDTSSGGSITITGTKIFSPAGGAVSTDSNDAGKTLRVSGTIVKNAIIAPDVAVTPPTAAISGTPTATALTAGTTSFTLATTGVANGTTFAVTGLPTGVTQTTTATTGDSTTVTLAVAATTAYVATSALGVTFTSPNLTATGTVNLTMTKKQAGAFTLSAPSGTFTGFDVVSEDLGALNASNLTITFGGVSVTPTAVGAYGSGKYVVTIPSQTGDGTKVLSVTMSGTLTNHLPYATPVTVTPAATPSGETSVTTYAQLTAALADESIAKITLTTDIIAEAEMSIPRNVTIDGGGHTLSATVTGTDEWGKTQTGSTYTLLTVPIGKTLALSNMTIKGGSKTAVINNGTLGMNKVIITQSGNSAATGGGLSNTGKAVLTNCALTRNVANNGGGFLNERGTMIMDNCSVTENRSLVQGGGGGENKSSANLYLNNCTFANNQSKEIGGGINNYEAKLYVLNTTVVGNISDNDRGADDGGGIGYNGGTVTLVNSIVSNNYAKNNARAFVTSDIGVRGGNTLKAYHSLVGAYVTDVTGTPAAVPGDHNDTIIAGVFAGYLDSVLLDGSGVPIAATGLGKRPVLVKQTNGTYAAPLSATPTDNKGITGGCDVRFAYNPATAAVSVMAYNTTAIPTFGVGTDSDKVVTFQDGSTRSTPNEIRGGMKVGANYFTVKVEAPVNCIVTGGSAFGDTYASGTRITLTADPADGYYFVGWYDETDMDHALTTAASYDHTVSGDITIVAKVAASAQEPTPEATFEASTMTLTSLANDKYSVDGGTTWTEITGGTPAVLTGVTTTHDIWVRRLGNGTTTSDSEIQKITITKGATPACVAVQPATVGGTGSITGVTTAMEFRIGSSGVFAPCTGNISAITAPATYEIRTKATSNVLASDIQTIVIKAYAAPSVITAGRYTWDQVFDCYRSPSIPTNGQPFNVYNFARPYDAVARQQITQDYITTNSSAVIYIVETGGVPALWISVDATVGGTNDRALSTRGTIYGKGSEGFLYISSDGISGGYGYFISTNKHTEGGDVTYVPDGNVPAVTPRTKLPTPAASFNGNTRVLSGVTDTQEYSLDGGATWEAISGTTATISATVDESYGIWVREPSTDDATHITSDVQKIYLIKTAGPTATDIRVGQRLDASTLSGGKFQTLGATNLDVQGTFTWKSADMVMQVGGDDLPFIAVFTPNGGAFGPIEVSVNVNVLPALPTGGGDYTPPKKPVIIDGKTENIGTEKKTGGTTVITVDQPKLTEQIGKAKEESSVVVPVSTNTTATVSLVVKNVEDMAKKEMTLSVKTGGVTYDLPTASMDVAALAAAFPGQDTAKIPFEVTIKASDVKVEGTTVVVKPTGFTVAAVYGGKSMSVDKFSVFVDRTFEITKAQSEKITTAVVVESDGTLRHVPTYVFQKDGKYYATVKSMTNSVYALIENEVTFADAAGKWYEDVANEVGSRKIVVGTDKGTFNGDAQITRAEYATMMVRALGLPQSKSSVFTDVAANAWYAGYVATASEYGIVKGIGNNKFNPEGLITRQEAMQMIYNAFKLTGFPKLMNARNLAAEFSDFATVDKWASEAVSWCLNNNLAVNLKDTVKPAEEITRGEMSAMILLLLQRSELVDVR